MKKIISDKKNGNDLVVKKNDIIFSCFIENKLSNSTFSAFSTFSRKLLQNEISKNINKDTLCAYYFFSILNKKEIEWVGSNLFEEIEFLKKRILINTALNIYSKTHLVDTHIKNTTRPDNYFSFEEYVLVDVINEYKNNSIKKVPDIFEPIKHNNSFYNFLDWSYATNQSLKINDIFNLYTNGVFTTLHSKMNEDMMVNSEFYKDFAFLGEDGEVFFTSNISKNEIPFHKIINRFCDLLKTDWYVFFQTLQRLQQKGILETKNTAIITNPSIGIFPNGIINSFLLFVDNYDFKNLSKLIRIIIKQKKIYCKICENTISFSDEFMFCTKCGIKYKKKSYGAKLSNWQVVSGFFSGQILYFSRKFNNYMVLYEKQTSDRLFEFMNKDR